MKLNRREFLWQAGTLAAGALILPACATKSGAATAGGATKELGLQLYTVRNLLEQDLRGTLEKIAALGYKNMESAAGSKGHYYGMQPKEFTSMLDGMGMKLRSSHVGVGYNTDGRKPANETLTFDLQKLVDMAAESGQEFLTCAYLAPNERRNIDDYKSHIELFNRAGDACKKAGVKFAYHNHDFEFETLDGQVPYDLMLAQTDKDKVLMELDLYWVSKFGLDPVALFSKNPGRFPLWHVKDMDKTEKKFFTEVGNGSIDFKRIFENAKLAGLKYHFVEQDQTPGNPLDSISTSYTNLTKLLS